MFSSQFSALLGQFPGRPSPTWAGREEEQSTGLMHGAKGDLQASTLQGFWYAKLWAPDFSNLAPRMVYPQHARQGRARQNKKKTQGKTRQGKARGKNETKTPVVQRSKEKVKIMERFKTGSMVSALR